MSDDQEPDELPSETPEPDSTSDDSPPEETNVELGELIKGGNNKPLNSGNRYNPPDQDA
jgi:hypothetical protein